MVIVVSKVLFFVFCKSMWELLFPLKCMVFFPFKWFKLTEVFDRKSRKKSPNQLGQSGKKNTCRSFPTLIPEITQKMCLKMGSEWDRKNGRQFQGQTPKKRRALKIVWPPLAPHISGRLKSPPLFLFPTNFLAGFPENYLSVLPLPKTTCLSCLCRKWHFLSVREWEEEEGGVE